MVEQFSRLTRLFAEHLVLFCILIDLHVPEADHAVEVAERAAEEPVEKGNDADNDARKTTEYAELSLNGGSVALLICCANVVKPE